MNEVNKTLFIPLYGKAQVSKRKIILNDPMAEKIWDAEAFLLNRKSKSKWLTYIMAMRARIFDDWTRSMLAKEKNAVVIHLGCGLDSRYLRVKGDYSKWFDCDFPDVIDVRARYYHPSEEYVMVGLDARSPKNMNILPDSECAVVILEGISMYLSNGQLRDLFEALQEKYQKVMVLMDIYTVFGAKASKYKNPVNDVGVTTLYGVDNLDKLIEGTRFRVIEEHSLTPESLVDELNGFDKRVFKLMFTGKVYGKIYRLFELSAK
ncbi:MAG: class I SAM-dependent methyltransferase [Eubacteriaceae bacterium]|jgi:O-methyltransferase involved in polyketide biosynthesis